MYHPRLPDTIHSDKVASTRPLAGSKSFGSVLDADLSILDSVDGSTITTNCLSDFRFQDSHLTSYYLSNQQFSVTAVTTSTGSVAERYAYTAYGQTTFLAASGTPLTSQTSTLNARYLYTGREWDETLGLYHFRARWMSSVAVRILGRDPIGYIDGESLYRSYLSMNQLEPIGNRIQGPRAPRRREGWRQAYRTEVHRCFAISFGTDCLWSCRVTIKEMIEVTYRDRDAQLLMGIFAPHWAQRTIPAPQDACTCPAEYKASWGTPPRNYVAYGPFILIELFPIPPNNGPVEYV